MTVVLDLDDVLANLRERLYLTISAATGIDKHWRDWQHYDLTQHFEIAKEPLDALLLRERVLEQCEPEPGAAAACRQLRAKGCSIVIATARGWHPEGYDITADWLQRQAIPYDHLKVVPLGGNKLEALAEFADIRVAVDDHPSNLKRYEAAGIPSLMVDMPWNSTHRATRIHSLDAVIEFIEGSEHPESTEEITALDPPESDRNG